MAGVPAIRGRPRAERREFFEAAMALTSPIPAWLVALSRYGRNMKSGGRANSCIALACCGWWEARARSNADLCVRLRRGDCSTKDFRCRNLKSADRRSTLLGDE